MAGRSSEANGDEGNSRGGAEQAMKPVFFEIFGEMWKVQARLGQGVSASVYRVSSGRASLAAVKEFQVDAQGGDYGYHKERSVLEDIQGRKNIGKALWCLIKADRGQCFTCAVRDSTLSKVGRFLRASVKKKAFNRKHVIH